MKLVILSLGLISTGEPVQGKLLYIRVKFSKYTSQDYCSMLPNKNYFTGDIKVGILLPVIAVICTVVLLPAFILIYKRYGMLICFLRGSVPLLICLE